MTLRGSIFRGAATLGLGHVLGQGLTLGRNIIVARTLTQSDVGVASTFITAWTLIEMASNVRSDAMIIQAEDGDATKLQNAAHLLEIMRGAFLSLVIMLLAGPAAFWFDIPEAAWAFRSLAIVPLAQGFTHLDVKRLQREFAYKPELWVNTVPQVLATLAAWPLCNWFGDYSAVLWLLVFRMALTVTMSHFVAVRPYRLSFHRTELQRIFRFGWPLLTNGLLLFAIFQGDRVIIGSRYTHFTLADLGLYGMAWNTAAAAQLLVNRITAPLLLPLFSKLRNNPERLAAQYARICQALSVLGSISCIPFFAAGGLLMHAVYGPEYAAAGSFIGWIAAAQAIRALRFASTGMSVAFSDTKNPLYSNLFRSLSLLVATGAALSGASLTWIALSNVLGEIVALLVGVRRLRSIAGMRPVDCLVPAMFTGACIVAGWITQQYLSGVGALSAALGCALTVLAILGFGLLVFPSLREEAYSLGSRLPWRLYPRSRK